MSSLWEPVTHRELGRNLNRAIKAHAKTGITSKEAEENMAKSMKRYFEAYKKVEEVDKGEET